MVSKFSVTGCFVAINKSSPVPAFLRDDAGDMIGVFALLGLLDFVKIFPNFLYDQLKEQKKNYQLIGFTDLYIAFITLLGGLFPWYFSMNASEYGDNLQYSVEFIAQIGGMYLWFVLFQFIYSAFKRLTHRARNYNYGPIQKNLEWPCIKSENQNSANNIQKEE